jgi:hypothetical protein
MDHGVPREEFTVQAVANLQDDKVLTSRWNGIELRSADVRACARVFACWRSSRATNLRRTAGFLIRMVWTILPLS